MNEAFWIGAASEIEGGGGGPTWSVSTPLSLTPSSCTLGACTTLVDLAATFSGTATGAASTTYDCDITGGYSGTAAGSCNSASSPQTCSLVDVCNYAALAPGVYTAEMRSTKQGVTATTQATFTVGPPPTVTGMTLSLNEPTEDVNTQPRQTRSSGEVERFVDGVLVDTVFRPASGPGGGGRWPTGWAEDLLVSQCGAKTLTGQATCTNAKGKSTTTAPSPIVTGPCPEGPPKPPTFSLLGWLP